MSIRNITFYKNKSCSGLHGYNIIYKSLEVYEYNIIDAKTCSNKKQKTNINFKNVPQKTHTHTHANKLV